MKSNESELELICPKWSEMKSNWSELKPNGANWSDQMIANGCEMEVCWSRMMVSWELMGASLS